MDPGPRTARRAVDRSERPDRQQAILLAAEKLFAQHGYRAVSIRQIAEEAGVPLALVSYYHGQKHELFQAIFDHWRSTVDERLALLAVAREGTPGPRMLKRVVEAFVAPVLRLRASEEGEYYAQLVARELFYRTPEAAQVLEEHFDPMAHAFIDALHAACPGSTRAAAAWAYQFAVGALLHHISDDRVERLSRRQNRTADAGAGPLLVDFISAGTAAVLVPAPSTATRTPKRRQA
ncbi:TetR/AcrR family transcriptional regulator [Ramlibacter pallidus]|uniref:TetR family transcriptional regulator n=1 Tax=Ramlibacter pallidus TaxID=2780087 RepID=A0ABR9S278_9BURK|nr:TetR/AcrR family transcriptional regulator [Ramlibacter pallidus]MBE7367603.1 TetR family transcriptional regulator [Ramlibacter pallidus]